MNYAVYELSGDFHLLVVGFYVLNGRNQFFTLSNVVAWGQGWSETYEEKVGFL